MDSQQVDSVRNWLSPVVRADKVKRRRREPHVSFDGEGGGVHEERVGVDRAHQHASILLDQRSRAVAAAMRVPRPMCLHRALWRLRLGATEVPRQGAPKL